MQCPSPLVDVCLAAGGLVHRLQQSAHSLPLTLPQTLLFLVLATITINRRRLSANREYRERESRSERERQRERPRVEHRRVFLARLWRFISLSLSRVRARWQRLFVRGAFASPATSPAVEKERERERDGERGSDIVTHSPSHTLTHTHVYDHTHAHTLTPRAHTRTHTLTSLESLSPELLLHCLVFLSTADTLRLALCSRSLHGELLSDDPHTHPHTDAMWEQLWRLTYAQMWTHPAIHALRRARGVAWDPLQGFGAPQRGWRRFFLSFEACWADWLLAGHCTAAHRCVLALHGGTALFDVTDFLPEHPGSPETLTVSAGCDATETFAEIGHSSHAERLLRRLCIFDALGDYSEQEGVHLHAHAHTHAHAQPHAAHTRKMPRLSPLTSVLRAMQREAVRLADDLLPSRQRGLTHTLLSHSQTLLSHSQTLLSQSQSLTHTLSHTLRSPQTALLSLLPEPTRTQLTSLSLNPTQPLAATEQEEEEEQERHEEERHEEEPRVQTSPREPAATPERRYSLSIGGAGGRQRWFSSEAQSLFVRDLDAARLGFRECGAEVHEGPLKAFFDPLCGEWTAWCAYCGKGYALCETPPAMENISGAWIFT